MPLSSGGTIKLVASSTAESKLCGLLCNAQDGTILHLTLNVMGHQQTKATPIYLENTTSVSIANISIKKQWSRAMDMHYFWVVRQVNLDNFRVIWAPGLDNLADYSKKHYSKKHHVASHHRKSVHNTSVV